MCFLRLVRHHDRHNSGNCVQMFMWTRATSSFLDLLQAPFFGSKATTMPAASSTKLSSHKPHIRGGRELQQQTFAASSSENNHQLKSTDTSSHRKKVVFSTENLRSNKTMMDASRVRMARDRSRSRSPAKGREGGYRDRKNASNAHNDRNAAGQLLMSPASVAPGRGFSSQSPKKPAQSPTYSKKRPLEHLSNTYTPPNKRRVLAATPETEEETDSEDELGQIDELGYPDTDNPSVNGFHQSPVCPPLSTPKSQVSAAKRAALVAARQFGLQHSPGSKVNGRFQQQQKQKQKQKNTPGTGPRKKMGLSVWRLASPPKTKPQALLEPLPGPSRDEVEEMIRQLRESDSDISGESNSQPSGREQAQEQQPDSSGSDDEQSFHTGSDSGSSSGEEAASSREETGGFEEAQEQANTGEKKEQEESEEEETEGERMETERSASPFFEEEGQQTNSAGASISTSTSVKTPVPVPIRYLDQNRNAKQRQQSRSRSNTQVKSGTGTSNSNRKSGQSSSQNWSQIHSAARQKTVAANVITFESSESESEEEDKSPSPTPSPRTTTTTTTRPPRPTVTTNGFDHTDAAALALAKTKAKLYQRTIPPELEIQTREVLDEMAKSPLYNSQLEKILRDQGISVISSHSHTSKVALVRGSTSSTKNSSRRSSSSINRSRQQTHIQTQVKQKPQGKVINGLKDTTTEASSEEIIGEVDEQNDGDRSEYTEDASGEDMDDLEMEDNNETPSESRPLFMCGKRLYSDWIGNWKGKSLRVPGAGALFPEGYEPRINDPEPWICPVRDCQTIFSEAWALGGHFNASHRATLLNDNRDGTMSVVGKRQHPDPNSKRMPALVISRVPIDPATAPPKASPRKPVRKKRSRATASPSKNKQQQTKSITIASSPSMARKNSYIVISNPPTFPSFSAQKPKPVVPLWEYLKTYLPKETRYPQETVLKELLSFPRQRELPHRWKLQISGFKQRLDNKTLAAVVVNLVGNKNSERCGTCRLGVESASVSKSFRGGQLPKSFPECISLPDSASQKAREYIGEIRGSERCCTCFVQGVECLGLFRGWRSTESEKRDGLGMTETEDEDDDEEEEDEEGIETSEDVLAMELEKAQQHLKKTQVNKVQEDEETEEEEAEEESEESPTPTPEPRGTRRSGRLAKTTAATATTRTTTSKTTATRSNARGERPPGAPIESYMMSEWEMVPGRIRVGTGSRAENIAFSSTYLAHSHVSPVSMTSNGISFQLLNIQPGKPVQWPSSNKNDQDDDTTRICSVAQGIVNVKVAGREFPLGPNGVWKVSPGQKCEVGSVWYGGAVVHVVRVQEAEEEYEE